MNDIPKLEIIKDTNPLLFALLTQSMTIYLPPLRTPIPKKEKSQNWKVLKTLIRKSTPNNNLPKKA